LSLSFVPSGSRALVSPFLIPQRASDNKAL